MSVEIEHDDDLLRQAMISARKEDELAPALDPDWYAARVARQYALDIVTQRERWRNSVRDGWPTSELVAIHDNEYGDFDVCYLVDDKECASYRSEKARFWWYEGENFDYYSLPDVPENEE